MNNYNTSFMLIGKIRSINSTSVPRLVKLKVDNDLYDIEVPAEVFESFKEKLKVNLTAGMNGKFINRDGKVILVAKNIIVAKEWSEEVE